MYYKQVSLRPDLVININYYSENKFGIDMVKTQINTIDSLLVIIIFTDKKIIHSHIVCLLNRMHEMQWLIVSIFKHKIVKFQKTITIFWLIHRTW